MYKCAKAVLKLKSMTSKSATLAELGWLPFLDELALRRISYFHHLRQMDDSRICKQVFNELEQLHTNEKVFNYFECIQTILNNKGMDFMLHENQFNLQGFKDTVKACYREKFTEDICNQPSMRLFKNVISSTDCSPYLLANYPYECIKIKCKLRLGIAGIGEDLYRQHRDRGDCKSCGAFENLRHLLFECPVYNSDRSIFLKNIHTSIGDKLFNVFYQDLDFAVLCVLGDHDDTFNKHFMSYISKVWEKRRAL